MIIGNKRITVFWFPVIHWLFRKTHFPISYYTFERCSCGCTEHPGWGMALLVVGFSVEYLDWDDGEDDRATS